MATEEEVESPRRRPGRGRIIGVIAVLALLILLASLRGIFTLFTNYLWYDDIGRTSEWTTVIQAQVVLSVVFVAIFFVLAWLNLVVADRIAPALRPPGPEEELLARWHDTVGRRTGLVRFLIAGFFAVIAGAGAASQWNEWILFSNRVDFGIEEPLFGEDVGFYVFRLPFLTFVVSWFFAAFIIIGIITAIWHYINGGIRIQTVDRRTTPQVKAHLSVILAILALLKAADYWLQRYELLGSTQGFRRGAFYTDINANLPAIQLLLLISLFSVGLLVANIWRRGWALPAIAVGLWALIAVVAGGIYPAAIQQLRVSPAELAREEPYIERNIEFTRIAQGLDSVTTGDFSYTGEIDFENTEELTDVLSNVRLLDPRIVDDSFTLNQVNRDLYRAFSGGVDVDRYVIDGELTPVVVGVRELGNPTSSSWEVQHAVETHGYGLVVAPANQFNETGQPDFVVRDSPLRSDVDEIMVDQPQVYFGDGMTGYAVINTTQREFDFVPGFSYDGEGSLPMSSFLRRLAFSFRFNALEPLISGTITDETEVIFARDVTERARRIAPFLHYDSNPYPVVVDGGIVYVIDAYTTSDMYPYAERADVRQLSTADDLRHDFNYVRNSVKVVVDAYDGTVDFYVVDDEDPVLRAYRQQFDDLFRSIDEMPAEIRSHLRFPEDLFRIQTASWGRYQLSDPRQFFDGILAWEVADNSDSVSGGQRLLRIDTSDPANPRVVPDRNRPVDPYYQVTRLPDEEDTDFIISRPFVPVSRGGLIRELTAYVIGRTDENGQSELRQYVMTTGDNVEVRGPFQIDEDLNSNPTISEESTELGRGGSQFLPGNLMVLLVDEAVVYVRPFYVRREPPSENPTAPTEPLIKFVAAVQEERIGFAPTYAGAIAQLFSISIEEAAQLTGSAVPVDADDGPAGVIEGPLTESVAERLSQATAKFDEAIDALPDFAEYERLLEEHRQMLEDLQADLDAEAAAEEEEPDEPEAAA